jgi:hypothetical protein
MVNCLQILIQAIILLKYLHNNASSLLWQNNASVLSMNGFIAHQKTTDTTETHNLRCHTIASLSLSCNQTLVINVKKNK